MNRIMKRIGSVLALGILAVGMFGCGLSQQKTDDKTKSANTAKKTYVVATRGTYRPYTYQDDKGNLTGYDVEILKEIEKRC